VHSADRAPFEKRIRIVDDSTDLANGHAGLAQAKISNLDITVFIEKNVVQLQIPVSHNQTR
jgi:hypothetical protein